LLFVGSLLGYPAYVYALKHLPVSTVSLYAYFNPVIAVVLGTVLLDEPFGPRVILAAALVFLGSAVVRWAAQNTKKTELRTLHSVPSSAIAVESSASAGLNDSSAADQPHEEQHYGNDQQNPDKVTERVPTDHP
jgi:hypothetical protein